MKILKKNDSGVVIYGTNNDNCRYEIINNTLYLEQTVINNFSSFNATVYEYPSVNLPTPFYSGYHYYTPQNGWSFIQMYNENNTKNKNNLIRLIDEYEIKITNPNLTPAQKVQYTQYIDSLKSLNIQYTPPTFHWPIPPDYICAVYDYDPFSLNPNSVCS